MLGLLLLRVEIGSALTIYSKIKEECKILIQCLNPSQNTYFAWAPLQGTWVGSHSTPHLAYCESIFRLLLKIAVGWGARCAYINFLENIFYSKNCRRNKKGEEFRRFVPDPESIRLSSSALGRLLFGGGGLIRPKPQSSPKSKYARVPRGSDQQGRSQNYTEVVSGAHITRSVCFASHGLVRDLWPYIRFV